MVILTCYTDGGYDNSSRGNGTGYGSFRIYEQDTDTTVRLKFPDVNSSNEAEYQTLIELLRYILEHYDNPVVYINSDSKLVCNQVNSIWEIHAEKLVPFFQTCVQLLSQIDTWSLTWQPRKILVAELGH